MKIEVDLPTLEIIGQELLNINDVFGESEIKIKGNVNLSIKLLSSLKFDIIISNNGECEFKFNEFKFDYEEVAKDIHSGISYGPLEMNIGHESGEKVI